MLLDIYFFIFFILIKELVLYYCSLVQYCEKHINYSFLVDNPGSRYVKTIINNLI